MPKDKIEKNIYLDNNATTALDPRVWELLQTTLKESFGNPSSIHSYGQQAKALLNDARRKIASIFHVLPEEILFTSGGTEGINLLLRGFFGVKCSGHIITSNVEHAAVYETILQLKNAGCAVSFIDVGSYGAAQKEQVEALIRPDTRLIVLMSSNNETGVKTDIEAISKLAEKHAIPFFVDAIASFGKEPISFYPGVSGMVFSGHKFHGPKGTGFILLRKGVKLTPYITGGTQEMSLRAGTENVPGLVAQAHAAILAQAELAASQKRMLQFRNFFEKTLQDELDAVVINGEGNRTCNCSNLAFLGIEGEVLLKKLDLRGVAASHGSACSSGAVEPSRILLQMGLKRDRAASSLRFSLSRLTTEQEVKDALAIIIDEVRKLRATILSSLKKSPQD
jgi:cysteine desulfurase